jgi:hypothetical protein
VRDEVTAELVDTRPPLDHKSRNREAITPATVQKREMTPGQQALVEAAVDVAIDVTTTLVRELVVPLVREVALPAAKARIDEFSARRRVRAAQRAEANAQALEAKMIERDIGDEAGVAEPATREADETVEPSISVRRSDFLRAQIELKLAEDYAARKRWLLEHADVQDEDLTSELEVSITLVLDGRAAELGEEQREAVAAFLQCSKNPPSPSRSLAIEPEPDE